MAFHSFRTSDQLLDALIAKFSHKDKSKKDIRKVCELYNDLSYCSETLPGSTESYVSLSGTIPITYKGSVYNIPLSILLHPSHPERAPTVYVRPTPVMVVKPSSIVAPSGLVTLPYLTGWQQRGCDLVTLVGKLVSVFSQEPPVFSKSVASYDHSQAAPVTGLPYSICPNSRPPSNNEAVSSSATYNAYGTMSFVSNDQWGQPAVSATPAALDELSHLSLNNSSPRSGQPAHMPLSPRNSMSSSGSAQQAMPSSPLPSQLPPPLVQLPAPLVPISDSVTDGAHDNVNVTSHQPEPVTTRQPPTRQSSTELVSTIEQDMLTCPICLERFVQPKCLPCLHTFCQQCIQQHFARSVQNGHVDCPTCRKRIAWGPGSSVSALQTNFLVIRLMDTVQQQQHT